MSTIEKKIAIIGGGPSAVFAYKRCIELNNSNLSIEIFEKKGSIGSGMPYSRQGANLEHVTNVSGNEIPTLVTSISEWIRTLSSHKLMQYSINLETFHDYQVLPRLLFGEYLEDQFKLLKKKASQIGIKTTLHYNCEVIDVKQDSKSSKITVVTKDALISDFDYTILCMGHYWPKKWEGKIPDYFDSPYPPAKLALHKNHTVALKGSSLTAIDAIRTLARKNGNFIKDENGNLHYKVNDLSPNFKIAMHSRTGMLPAVRFHLEDSHLSNKNLLSREEIINHMNENDGFLSLDFIFEKDFKNILAQKDPEFYEKIKGFSIEEFVEEMMKLREDLEAFQLLMAEYREAEKSMKRHQSVHWKEMLAVLSFALNYPAKHLSAEDMLRLQKVLLPLISIVIAFVPQSSCEEMMALHNAGILEIIGVGHDSTIEPVTSGGAIYKYLMDDNSTQEIFYQTFIDCVGQPHLNYEDFPFKSLIEDNIITPAALKFKSASTGKTMKEDDAQAIIKSTEDSYYLKVGGIAINDNFQVLNENGAFNPTIYIMAVPFIGGYNPDYSGLDFCEEASSKIVKSIQSTLSIT